MSDTPYCTDKQVFPSLELIGWYTVAPEPTSLHISLHEQVCISFDLVVIISDVMT